MYPVHLNFRYSIVGFGCVVCSSTERLKHLESVGLSYFFCD
jgi:hypothetical protein